jgi:adenylosuccinate synthase
MKQVAITVDLGFGDSGKGTTVDALVRRMEAKLVVRASGGMQCGHTVVTSEGKRHIFRQFGSGTLAGARTFYGPRALFSPLGLVHEADQLLALGIPNPYALFHLHRDALLTSRAHVLLNRIRETLRHRHRHGSCGMGIGETRRYEDHYPGAGPRARDLLDRDAIRSKLSALYLHFQAEAEALIWSADSGPHQIAAQEYQEELNSQDEFEAELEVYEAVAERIHITDTGYLTTLLRGSTPVVFEGNQGVLLDEIHGFDPYHTWADTTATSALDLLDDAGYTSGHTIYGILRAYHTRHGAGPFPTESDELARRLQEPDNPENPWQGAFRVGSFDFVLADYALRCEPRIDGFALTHLDRFTNEDWTYVDEYRTEVVPTGRLNRLPEESSGALTQLLESCTPACVRKLNVSELSQGLKDRFRRPALMESYGPTADDKRFIEIPD